MSIDHKIWRLIPRLYHPQPGLTLKRFPANLFTLAPLTLSRHTQG